MAVGRRCETPYTREIHARTTRFEMEAAPRGRGGEPCVAVRVLCSVRVSSEQRFVGGASCRVELTAGVGDGGGKAEFAVHDPAVLRSEGACRGAIHRMLMTLTQLTRYYGDRADEAQWDEFVPPDVAASIVAVAARDDGATAHRSYACEVSMHVDASLVYREAMALVESCEAAAPTAAGRRDNPLDGDGGGIVTVQCVIFMEELVAGDDVTNLPCSSHAFHRGCILRWFDKAPTCPFCRRDMMQSHCHLSSLSHAAALYPERKDLKFE